MLLTGGYFSAKFYFLHWINSQPWVQQKIEFKNLSFGLFPPAVKIRNLKELVIKDKNIVSFKEIQAELPFLTLFSEIKMINIYIHEPRVVFDASLLKKRDKTAAPKKAPFKINKVNIVDGELVYNSQKFFANLVKFNLYSFPRENETIYRLTSPHLKVMFPVSGRQVTVEGQMIGEFKEQRSSWKIGKFYWETEHAKVNVNGRVYKKSGASLKAYIQGSARQILDPLLKKRSIRDFMYSDANIKVKKGGRITIDGKFNYNNFTFYGEIFKNMSGTAKWDNRSKRLVIDTTFYSGPLKTNVRVDKKKGKALLLTIENLAAEKACKAIDIYKTVPLGGILKKGTVAIKKRVFKGTVDLAQDPANDNPAQLNVAGSVTFDYNSKKKWAFFSSPQIRTEFGRLFALKGAVTPGKRTRLAIDLNAALHDTAYLDKYTRFFIGLSLDQWKLKKGKGAIDLTVRKIDRTFFVHSDIHLRDFYSGKETIQSLKGHVDSQGDITQGKFFFDDGSLTGEAVFSRQKKGADLKIHFNNIKGEAKKILNILEVDLSLAGRMQGDFIYSNKRGMPFPLVTGTFQAKKLNFYDFHFENLKGHLEYSQAVSLEDLEFQYMTGSGGANIFIDFNRKQFHLEGNVKAIDLNRMNNEFKGKGDISFTGQGAFDKDPITFDYRSGDIYFYKDQSFVAKGKGKIFTDFSSFHLETGGDIFSGTASSPYTLRLNQAGGQYSGDFHVDMTDIDLLIPWGNNKGEMKVDGRITGTGSGEIGAEGHAAFKGKTLSFPNFPHTLEDFSGDLIFQNLNFRLRSFRGFMGNGSVEGDGSLNIKDNKLDALLLRFSGKNMTLYPIDRTSFTMDTDLAIKYIKDKNKLLLSGELKMLSCLWEREVDESISFNTNPSLSASSSTIMDMLEFDLKMVAQKNARFNSSFGRAIGKFNLALTGNTDFPILLGVIESRKGTVNFSGKKFDLIRAKLTFNNKFRNAPLLNVESEAFIKNYRIKFNISGLSSKPKPELISSPPLPPRDILTLISVGELFRRPTSTELSSQIGVGTTGLIASELTEQIKKRTKKIFGNYLLRIAPNISNITGAPADTSRLIVGKEIAKDFLIVYSTDFSTQRQEVVYLQYQLSPSVSLIGMRNEEGRLSIDLRFRKRH